MEALHRLERYAPGGADTDVASWRREGAIVGYWLLALVLALVFQLPEPFVWNVWETTHAMWPVAFLTATLLCSQWLYSQVAIHEDRPFNWIGTPLFVIGNAVGETLAFLLVFSAGAWVGRGAASAVGLSGAPYHGLVFAAGFFVFLIYGGGIHGLFWMRIFPPHFKEDERARRIRRFRLWSETALSLSWCVTFYAFRDFWAVVIFHAIVDLVLMIRVRPRIFRFAARLSPQASA
jgi:chlorophyllide a hydrolase